MVKPPVCNPNARNFCIIAHIDHGKSTLADRLLETTHTVSSKDMQKQVLDDMDLERERGITIKSHPIRMEYSHTDGRTYTLNLIDTPGHVDFTYEVSRSLAACEGALLLVDASQGVEAQTVSNAFLAMEHDLHIIPVINKADLPNAMLEDVTAQIVDLIGCSEDEIITASAKTGQGVDQILATIIDRIPPPRGDGAGPARALIFDSTYDSFRGAIAYIRIIDGELPKRQSASFFAHDRDYEIDEVGIFRLKREPREKLVAGDVGYLIAGIKDVKFLQVGDTITLSRSPAREPLAGYKPIKPMVFAGLYPVSTDDFENLRTSLDKLRLNDASLAYIPETSVALGFGFRCGFLGLLHMEIIQERLEREFNLNLITTSPNVEYEVVTKDGGAITVDSPVDMPHPGSMQEIREPYIAAEIITPPEYLGGVMKLCQEKRGAYKDTHYMSANKVQLKYEMPLAEVIYDFFDRLKSVSRGYASYDYELIGTRPGALKRLDIMIAGEIVDALSIVVHTDHAAAHGRSLCKKLKEVIHRQQFEVPIQAAMGSRIIARETVKALRKNVTAKCYGGDITRKRKLLERQKEGKKRMKQVGQVEIPQEAFLSIMKVEPGD
ncbi:MAG: translation elongation factor 4 [Candidatus Marinimicrobia bacterium]|nr:translation elongation factor 4 [Candidatus Neomarinimicrobiota bacterium]